MESNKIIGNFDYSIYSGSMFQQLKSWARLIKRDVLALYLAARDPRVPWYAKSLAAFIAAYALSPVDLIPDFIPVIGYLDDLIILPLGIMLAVHMIPQNVMAELRQKANIMLDECPRSIVAAVIIILIWLVTVALVGLMLMSE